MIEAFIGLGDKPPVKSLPIDPGLVAACQKDCPAIRAEGKEDTPDAAVGIAPQLLHVRVLRACKRVDMWATELGAYSLQKTCLGQDRILDSCRKGIELGLEGIEELNDPFYTKILPQGYEFCKPMFPEKQEWWRLSAGGDDSGLGGAAICGGFRSFSRRRRTGQRTRRSMIRKGCNRPARSSDIGRAATRGADDHTIKGRESSKKSSTASGHVVEADRCGQGEDDANRGTSQYLDLSDTLYQPN